MGRTKNKGGKPSKLTEERTAKVVELIKAGNYTETAVITAGLGKSTHYAWMKKGKEAKRRNKFVEYREAIKEAEAWAESRHVAIISKHAETTWQASAWWLERKMPEKWAKREVLNVNADVKQEVKVDMSPVEEKAMAELLDTAAGIPEEDVPVIQKTIADIEDDDDDED